MTRHRFPALLMVFAAAPAPLFAQAMVQPLPGTTDADRLASQMRLLASNPTDVAALNAAGELSLKLDDLGAAASFFARAEKVDPHNGRAKAGEASILVHAERPGEALRYFQLAESYGAPASSFAADRGLAYDLVGEQERAQRDYRLALRTAPDDETARRYALSLGISGKRDLAEQQLQPLLRKSDRGAWRVHAFVLAMSGNVAEASRIATTMMPPGTAAGLQPFLERLPTLTAVDRAFAVHFGEVRSTPQRLADARLVPPLPVLGADPYAPRLAPPPTAVALVDKGKRRGKDKDRRAAVQVAVATPAPVPLPQAPAYRVQPSPATAVPRGAAPVAWPAASATLAAAAPRAMSPVAGPTQASSRPVTQIASPFVPVAPSPTASSATPVVRPAAPATTPLVPSTVIPRGAPPAETNVVVAAVTPPTRPTPVQAPPQPVTVPPQPGIPPAVPATAVASVSLPAARPAPPPEAAPTAVASSATSSSLSPVAGPVSALVAATTDGAAPATSTALSSPVGAATTPPVRAPRDNAALSQMIASLPIPGAELGVEGPVRSTAAAPATPEADADTAAQVERDREAARLAARKIAADRAAADKAAAAKALADKRAADRKVAADRKALAEKKAAAEEKAEEAREAAAQKKLERANPERIWVQVAGGAFEGDLSKAWVAAKAKGGDAFAGHATGWTTPLRATNRVLAGPFKTDAEAHSFVNKLKVEGLSAFAFTSEAGQVVTKLPTK